MATVSRPPYRRLLVLCACSACAHLAVLAWLDARMPPAPAPAGKDGEALAIRLAPPLPAAPAAADAETAATATAPSRALAALQPPVPRAGRAARRPQDPAAAAQAPPQPAGAPDPAASPPAAGERPVQMPGRYRVRLPDTVLLRYRVVRERAGAAPVDAEDGTIDWRADGERYRLSTAGILGRLTSEGDTGDAGLVPRRATEAADGAPLVTAFDAGAGRVRFEADGASAPDAVGIQDRASLLVQLAGIGLGDPEQVKDSVDVVVADAHQAAIARLRVLGRERVDAGAGGVDAWHLAGSLAPGQPPFEVWLAPALGWLPVQVRSTGPDGTRTTAILRETGS